MWGVVEVTAIEKGPDGTVLSMSGVRQPLASVKKLKHKFNWLARTQDILEGTVRISCEGTRRGKRTRGDNNIPEGATDEGGRREAPWAPWFLKSMRFSPHSWLGAVRCLNSRGLQVVEYDHLVTKPKLEEGENFVDFLNPLSIGTMPVLLEPAIRFLKVRTQSSSR